MKNLKTIILLVVLSMNFSSCQYSRTDSKFDEGFYDELYKCNDYILSLCDNLKQAEECISTQSDSEKLSKLKDLWLKFKENVNPNEDSSEAFANSEFINELKKYFSSRESLKISPSEFGRKILQNDLTYIEKSIEIEGKKHSVRAICYNADIYVQAMTDAPINSKWIFVQYWTEEDFYFYIISEGGLLFLDDMVLTEVDGKLFSIILTSATEGIPNPNYVWSFSLDKNGINETSVFDIGDENLINRSKIWIVSGKNNWIRVGVDISKFDFSYISPICELGKDSVKFIYDMGDHFESMEIFYDLSA